jgi:type II restriction enzyme
MRKFTPELLIGNPWMIPTLRSFTAPPIARDRLTGLSRASPNTIKAMENGKLPQKIESSRIAEDASRICATILKMLDSHLFPWIEDGTKPSEKDKVKAVQIISDRICNALSETAIRNMQERRQLDSMKKWLESKGYRDCSHSGVAFDSMEPKTFAFRVNIPIFVGNNGYENKINISVDAAVMKSSSEGDFPILIEAKSAGDYANTNKRRKEEAQKISQLRKLYGNDVIFVLCLCGYFNAGYLRYEASEGIDWIWEHRVSDLEKLGI